MKLIINIRGVMYGQKAPYKVVLEIRAKILNCKIIVQVPKGINPHSTIEESSLNT